VLISKPSDYVKEFQENRKAVTDEVLKGYMKPRKLEWKGNPNPVPKPEKAKGGGGAKKEAAKEAPKPKQEAKGADANGAAPA
jgi:tryptophanyl-tRNA synthetase